MANLQIAENKARSGKRSFRAVVGAFVIALFATMIVGASPAHADVYAGTLFKTLPSDHYILSTNGNYKLIMQTDGNLVLYRKSGGSWAACWGSNTWGQSISAAVLDRTSTTQARLTVGSIPLYGYIPPGVSWANINVNVNNSGKLYVAYTVVASC